MCHFLDWARYVVLNIYMIQLYGYFGEELTWSGFFNKEHRVIIALGNEKTKHVYKSIFLEKCDLHWRIRQGRGMGEWVCGTMGKCKL